MPASRRSRVFLLILSSILGLVGLELVLRYVLPPPTGIGWSRNPRSRIYGWAHQPGERIVLVNPDTRERWTLKMNSAGWKDAEHATEKPPGTGRILIVGDSVTYGIVRVEDQYGRRLEELLRREGCNVEVISMGYGGWSTDQSLLAIDHEGSSYSPDVIIHQYDSNDLLWNLKPNDRTEPSDISWAKRFKFELRNGALIQTPLRPRFSGWKAELKRRFLQIHILWYLNRMRHLQGGGGGSREAQPPRSASLDESRRVGSSTSHRLRGRRTELSSGFAPTNPAGYFKAIPIVPVGVPHEAGPESEIMLDAYALWGALIGRMNEIARRSEAVFAVYSPDHEAGTLEWGLRHNYYGKDGEGDFVLVDGKRYAVDLLRPLRTIREILNQRGIPFIQATRKYGRWANDPHPNAEGNLAMAEDLRDAMLTRREFSDRLSRYCTQRPSP